MGVMSGTGRLLGKLGRTTARAATSSTGSKAIIGRSVCGRGL